jgi:hypothetical protein
MEEIDTRPEEEIVAEIVANEREIQDDGGEE